jgi:hypothetical protein
MDKQQKSPGPGGPNGAGRESAGGAQIHPQYTSNYVFLQDPAINLVTDWQMLYERRMKLAIRFGSSQEVFNRSFLRHALCRMIIDRLHEVQP